MAIMETFNPDSLKLFRGYEMTLKRRLLGSGITALDAIIGGGIVRGRISEIVGPAKPGRNARKARLMNLSRS